jgi:ABC-type multidrug transport system ATPase subunit
MGLDPRENREELHQIVGAQLQASALPGLLRVREILGLYRSFYKTTADIAELIRVLGLAGKLKSLYMSLSGGQKQRHPAVACRRDYAGDRESCPVPVAGRGARRRSGDS